MSNIEFVLPVNKDDLCSGPQNQYVVRDIISVRDINSVVLGLQRTLVDEGLDFIHNNFDVFYSILRHFAKLETEIRLDSWQVLMSVATKLSNAISFVVDNEDEHVDYESRTRYRNLLKMTVYLLCQMAEAFEADAMKPSNEVIVSAGKGNRKRRKNDDECSWDEEREGLILVLSQLYQKPIHKLWDPPVIEEDFLGLGTGCCFRMLENANVAKNKNVRKEIFDFLGVCIKKHSNTLGFSIKIIQLLQDYEHLVSPLANAVCLFVNEYGAKNIIPEIIREAGCIEIKDLSRDTSGMRSISQFIVELAALCPSQVLASVSLLLPYLDEDAYSMRNCVLSVLGEIVAKVLTGDGLDEKAKDLRDQILDKLEEHIHDVAAFVRSKCLQIWKQLCSAQAIPLPRQYHLLELIMGRLYDKSCNVRKYAVQFLTVFLQMNPFSAKLSVEEVKKNVEKEKKKLEKMLAEGENACVQIQEESPLGFCDDDDIRKTLNFDEEEDESGNKRNKETADGAKNQDNQENVDSVVNVISKQQVLVKYLEDTEKFAQQITKALSVICEFMKSKIMTDVIEAIDFFVTAFQFGVRGAVKGVKQMLNLVWTKENAIKEAVLAAYRHLYFKTEETNSRSRAVLITENLMGFLKDATISEVACIEELVKEFVKTGDIDSHVIKVLWERFTKKLPDTSDEQSYACLVLLSMAAGCEKQIVSSNIDNLVSVGFGERAKSDFQFARETCIALLKIRTVKPNVESKDPPLRFKETDDVFLRLTELLIEGITNIADFSWVPFAEQAVNVIYSLADFPEQICCNIVKKLASIIISDSEKDKDASEFPDDPNDKCSSLLLCRFITVCGHIALAQVTHLEANVLPELKRRQNLKEKSKCQRSTRHSRNKSVTPISKANETEEDTGLIGAVADDAEAEFIRKICETEILKGMNLLGMLCPFIVSICRDPSKYAIPDLCASSSLALAKCMMISSDFCENNMQLLVTIMEKSSDSVTRANIIIALGDLATRFPNVIEPWTPHLYGRLKDSSVHVRKYTVSVLTHLVLHDMIKVKGQISDIALCIVDEDEKVVEMAKFLFEELSKKGNALYNIIPDIISRLSVPHTSSSEENFQIIIKFLMQFIDKDRQIESLVDKLSQRFICAETDIQRREIAFCMNQLSFNDKCLSKLQEKLAHAGDKFKDPAVHGYFVSIVNASKKSGKAKAESEIDALMKLLEN